MPARVVVVGSGGVPVVDATPASGNPVVIAKPLIFARFFHHPAAFISLVEKRRGGWYSEVVQCD